MTMFRLKFVLLTGPITCLTMPVFAEGNHHGWCVGVGNPHNSHSCSSSTPVWTPPHTQTPVVTQLPPKPVTTTQTPTPTQIVAPVKPYVPKRPPSSRHPVVIVQQPTHPPYATLITEPTPSFTLPGGANVQPPLRPQEPPILQQQPPPLQPQPQQPPVVNPIIAPPLPQPQVPQQVAVAIPQPQQPPVVNPIVAPPLPQPQVPQQVAVAVPQPQQPPVVNPIIAPPLPQPQVPQQVAVAIPQPQQPPVVNPIVAPPLPQPQVPQQVTVAVPQPQQPPVVNPIVEPPLPQPQVPQQVAVAIPQPQQPPALQPVLQPQVPQPPLQTPTVAPDGVIPVVVLTPLPDPGFVVPGGGKTPVKVDSGVSVILQPVTGMIPKPIVHRPRPYTKPVNVPEITQSPVIVKPLDPPGFVTPGGGQRPTISGSNSTIIYQPVGDPKPNQVDPLLHVPIDAGRHPAHDLPVFDTPSGAAQCLLSGYGRRYWIDEKGVRHETGMPATLRGFGPIMRDVPAFTHQSAGCVLLVYRREDRRERN